MAINTQNTPSIVNRVYSENLLLNCLLKTWDIFPHRNNINMMWWAQAASEKKICLTHNLP